MPVNPTKRAPEPQDRLAFAENMIATLREPFDYARVDVAIRESELRFRRLFETARDGILILDQSTGKVIAANPFMSELLGYEHGFFLGKELWEIGLFNDISANQAAFRELQASGYIRYDHLPLETKARGRVEVEFVSNGYDVDGRKFIQCNIRERTEASRLEQKIKRSLEEKEVLLKEVHHRVKNNLQVVYSLLDLQSQYSHDPATVEMLRESQHRVRSMAMVHERLYQSQEFTNVDFTDYIESLSNHLFRSYQVDGRIRLEVDVRGVRLSIERAVPCGLLVNELISNCLKHAFKGREHGRIRIQLRTVAQDEILLAVSDDGVGLSPSTEPGTTATFGMQLVGALVNQLHGKFSIHREAGTTIRIVFPQTK